MNKVRPTVFAFTKSTAGCMPTPPHSMSAHFEALALEKQQEDYMTRGKPKFPWKLHQFAGGSVNLLKLTAGELFELRAKCDAWYAVNALPPFMTQQPNLELVNGNTTTTNAGR